MPFYDHNGTPFPSKKAMCDKYNIRTQTFDSRLEKKWSLKDALTIPTQSREVTDHLGNVFSSLSVMCDHYDINMSCYKTRIKNGWSQEKALTTPTEVKAIVTDHLGNEYDTTKQMCEHYGITYSTYRHYINKGLSKQEILEKQYLDKSVTDHLGNEFKNIDEMADHWKISKKVLYDRIQRNMPIEKALTMPTRKISSDDATDHTGQTFDSIKSMCEYWNIKPPTYFARVNNGMSKKDALTMIPDNSVLLSGYRVIQQIDKTYYECEIGSINVIRSRKQIQSDILDMKQQK